MAKRRPRCWSPISSRMKGNFWDRRNDDLLAGRDEAAQVTPERAAWPTVRADLGVLLDGVADLLVEDAPIGNHDDRVEDLACRPFASPIQFDAPARRWSCSCRCRPSAGSDSAAPRRAPKRLRAAGVPPQADDSAARSESAFSGPSSRRAPPPAGRSSPESWVRLSRASTSRHR